MERFANPPNPSSGTRWVLAHLSVPISTTPAAGTVESYNVDAVAPGALQDGEFAVVIGDEYMMVSTPVGGGNPWSFTRGAEGGLVTPHLSGDPIYHVPTAGAIQRALGENLEQAMAIAVALG